MRTMMLLVLLAGLLLPVLSRAADTLPQPDAQDWSSIENISQKLSNQYFQMLTDIAERITNVKNNLHGNPSNAGELKLALADAERSRERYNKALTALKTITAEVKAMQATDRTRAKYLQLRRRVKEWEVQLGVDQRLRYRSDYADMGEMASLSTVARRMQALKANPPETLPVGPRPQGLALDWQTIPRLDGSTTAQPLNTLILCRFSRAKRRLAVPPDLRSRQQSGIPRAHAGAAMRRFVVARGCRRLLV